MMKKAQLLLMAIALAAGGVWAGESVDVTKSASVSPSVDIENLAGSVRINGWDREEIKVSGVLGDDTDGLDFSGSGDSFDIEVEIPDSYGRRHRDLDSDLEIWLPAGSSVSVETVSASIRVSGVDGRLELESVSGEVSVDGAPTSVDVETVSGSIELSGSGTLAIAESVSGKIELSGVAGRVEAATVSGSVKVEASDIEQGEFEAVSGSVRFTGALSAGARLSAESHSGSVVLNLPADTSARFQVETFSGSINNGFGGGEAERTSRYGPGKRLDFTLGSGDAQVRVESFSGSVTLKPQ
ncbi:MAG: DUF4097 family beta strand repeat-containing protein [Thermoanaerobaculia bacterium]|jgi:DUF4097 and DUF4098 domain-containing protein YvlB